MRNRGELLPGAREPAVYPPHEPVFRPTVWSGQRRSPRCYTAMRPVENGVQPANAPTRGSRRGLSSRCGWGRKSSGDDPRPSPTDILTLNAVAPRGWRYERRSAFTAIARCRSRAR